MNSAEASQAPGNIRTTFLINSLEGGGAERVFSLLVNEFVRGNNTIKCVVLDDRPCKYNIPNCDEIVYLNGDTTFGDSSKRFKQHLEEFKPHTVVSFLTRANCVNTRYKKAFGYTSIISERSNTLKRISGNPYRFLVRQLVYLAYARADQIIAVSEGVGNALKVALKKKCPPITTIPNPYDLSHIAEESQKAPDKPVPAEYILAAGRLVKTKGFDTLLYAYAELQPTQSLVILGEGPEYGELQSLAEELGIADKVFFLGFVANPYAYMARAKLFVLSSTLEGFPNALVEAMACGCPVVATNCDNGPAEILAEQAELQINAVELSTYGLLVPINNPREMKKAMATLIDDPQLHEHYAQKSAERAHHFSLGKVTDLYRNAIFKLSKPGGGTRKGDEHEDNNAHKIAFLGGRGYYSNYGGVENAMRELSFRLVNEQGFNVDVYGHGEKALVEKTSPVPGLWNIAAPALIAKLGGNSLVPFFAAFYALLCRRPDTAIIFASGPSMTALLFKLFGVHTICGLRAIDSQRDKWGLVNKTILRIGEYCATHVADVCTVNSREMLEYYTQRGCQVTYIPNGASPSSTGDESTLVRYQVEKDNYLLFIARFDPVKRLHLLLEAYKKLSQHLKIPLVIAGGESKSEKYTELLRNLSSPGVIFVGHVDKSVVDPLMRNCFMFVQPSILEGMSNSLLAAMHAGRPTICADIKPNRDVVQEHVDALFEPNSADAILQKLEHFLANRDAAVRLGEKLRRHAIEKFDWSVSAQSYSKLVQQLGLAKPHATFSQK